MFGLFKKRPKEIALSLLELPSDGFCAVSGESHYQEALRATRSICEGEFEGRPCFTAALVPEPQNEYDPNAIAVYSPKGKLGYIPRDRAGEYRALFAELVRRGYNGGGCAAHLTGGDSGKSYGVVLRLADPDACLKELDADAV